MAEIVTPKGTILLDDADVELVGTGWYAVDHDSVFYAMRKRNGRTQYMHRLLMGFPSVSVDHRNRNGLDNRRANLRLATPRQQSVNKSKSRTRRTSRFLGVFLDSETGKWTAELRSDRHPRRIGRFTSEVEAARAYDARAREVYGEFAALNFEDAA